MNTSISFTVYGKNHTDITRQVNVLLADYSDTDTKWDVDLTVSTGVVSTNGEVNTWRAEVWARHEEGT